ncbi:RNA methyltransferase [Crocinitomix catalasitica]|uniref:RNA methyltransferase n=1 Tax=Crocinitomix catalasitica TaxID=184607 RepID=UPI000481DD39|nr:RNA methyltransferase [Crocinitomix catalasitica]
MASRKKLKLDELERIDVATFKESEKTPIIIVLDNIRSLNNIGSVFRTGDAFRIEKIYLCGITAQPPHRDIQKTALGATDSVTWEYDEDTVDLVLRLKEDGVLTYAVEQTENSIFLDDFKPVPNRKIAVVMGNEVEGVQQDVILACDGVIEIPQIGTKHSLNISVCTGVIVWDLFSKINKNV